MPNFKQGTYTPINSDKCINVTSEGRNPIFRSSWELRVFEMMDTNINVKRWGSELKKTMIKYKMPTSKNPNDSHTYIPDIYVEIIDKDTKEIVRYLIEVKPKKDGAMPSLPSKQTPSAMKKYNERMGVYIKNKAKWQSAQIWCQQRGMIFKVFTEDTIFKHLNKPNQ